MAIISLREVTLFYVIRFIALPLLLFYITQLCTPEFANGVLLMALTPAGVSSVVPAFFEILSDTSVEIDTVGMFGTLSVLIFEPIIVDRLFYTVAPEKRLVI